MCHEAVHDNIQTALQAEYIAHRDFIIVTQSSLNIYISSPKLTLKHQQSAYQIIFALIANKEYVASFTSGL
jgi:hypothetical protein